MEIETSLKRIRLQIKHGRTDGVTEKLDLLLRQVGNTDDEVRVLKVYALEFFNDYAEPASVMPIVERLLSLDITNEMRSAALQRLEFFRQRAELMPTDIRVSGDDFVACLNVIRSGEIFSFRPVQGSLADCEIVRDLTRAKMIAWHQEIGEPYMSWNSLRAKASAQVNGYLSWNRIGTDPLEPYDDEIAEYCDTLLSEVMMHFYDDILGDLTEILKGKAAGVPSRLHERMWQAYKAGVYPCGWKGNFPEGKICVFLP